MVLYLLNSNIDPTAKITWLVIIMMLLVFGALLFWYFQSDQGNYLARKHVHNLFTLMQDTIPQDPQIAAPLSTSVLEILAQKAEEGAKSESCMMEPANFLHCRMIILKVWEN